MARDLPGCKILRRILSSPAGGGEIGCGTMNQETVDEGAMLALNNEHREETSELDGAQLHALLAQGFHVGLRNAGRDAFLIAFDQDAISASPNFQWFKSRYERFVYIDRVIVAPGQRGRGVRAPPVRRLRGELRAAQSGLGRFSRSTRFRGGRPGVPVRRRKNRALSGEAGLSRVSRGPRSQRRAA
jgi:hypothetical protein